MAQAPRESAGGFLTACDGVRLRIAWGPAPPSKLGTVLILPGRAEFAEKFGRTMSRLRDAGYASAVIDWRGQGWSDRLAPDHHLGHVADFAAYQRDVAALLAAVDQLGLPQPYQLLAHSMGGCIGLRALIDGQLLVSAAAFSAPLWGVPLSLRQRALGRLVGRTTRFIGRDTRRVPAGEHELDLAVMGASENALTSDRAFFAHLQRMVVQRPELGIGAPTLGWLAAALREIACLSRLPSPALPAFVAVGSHDRVIERGAIARRVKDWPDCDFEEIQGARHELLSERPKNRERFLGRVLELFAGAG